MASNMTVSYKQQQHDFGSCVNTPHYRDKNLYVIAGTSCDESLLKELARSPQESIRIRVAENPCTPLFTLLLLSRDPQTEVRLALIDNPKATYSIICNLAKDDNPDVRFGLADNPTAPLSILCFLCQDENPYVAWRANSTIQKLFPEGVNMSASYPDTAISA